MFLHFSKEWLHAAQEFLNVSEDHLSHITIETVEKLMWTCLILESLLKQQMSTQK